MQGGPISATGQTFTLTISGMESVALRDGDLVAASVLSIREDRTASIRIKNTVLDVLTDMTLKKGDSLLLRVERQENTIYLRLITGSAGGAASIKETALSLLNGPDRQGSITQNLGRLADILKSVPDALKQTLPELKIIEKIMRPIEGLSGSALKDAISDSGILLETKLRLASFGRDRGGALGADLKTALLRIKDGLQKDILPGLLLSSGVRPEEVRAAIDAMLRNIEHLQLQSRLNNTLQTFIPLVWKEIKDGRLSFRESGHDKSGRPVYSCSISLDLEQAGRTRVDVLLHGGSFHLSFSAANNRFCETLEENSWELEERFAASGLNLARMTVKHEQKIDFGKQTEAGLDVRV